MQQQAKAWQQVAVVLVTVAGAVVIAWAEMPPDQRKWAVIEARARVQRWAHRSAQTAGQAGMGSELSGHEPTAQASYGVAYRLSRLRDRL